MHCIIYISIITYIIIYIYIYTIFFMFVIDFLSPMSFATGASASGSHAAKIAGLHSGTALHGRRGIGELSNTYFTYHTVYSMD